MNGTTVNLLDGNTFVVSDQSGDIEATASDPIGLFSFDTRFLSRWVLRINDTRLVTLSVDDLQYYQNRFFCVPARPRCTSTRSCPWSGCGRCATDSGRRY